MYLSDAPSASVLKPDCTSYRQPDNKRASDGTSAVPSRLRRSQLSGLSAKILIILGAGDANRTRDPNLGKALSRFTKWLKSRIFFSVRARTKREHDKNK